MAEAVDARFIRRAVELADLGAVRVALFAQTHDPEVGALPPIAKLDDAGRSLLIEKAVAWLEKNARPGMQPEPPADELRRLMNFATGDDMGDLEWESRRELAAFKRYPMTVAWPDGRPELPKDFKVAIIGASLAGTAMGVQLELLGIPYAVFDRRPEAGGTWSINRYPDIRVDTISISYEHFFEKNYPWTEYFARGAEVRRYIETVARKHGVLPHMRFERTLEKATFDERRSRWQLEFSTPNGRETFEANAVVSAVGAFTNPRFPRFEGQDGFRGRIVHPARWPEDFDARGKRIAVVGNGSTGVQLLSPIAKQAKQVHVFQRTPQWISPRDKYGKQVEPEIRWLLDHFPGYWNWWRYMATAGLFETHKFLLVDQEWKAQGGTLNPLNDKLRTDLTAYIRAQLGDREDLIAKLTPDYAPFSRRLVVDNGWYAALARDNVELVTEGIERLTPTGIETVDGRVRDIDILVTATGYEVEQYLKPAKYTGLSGIDLHDYWSKDGPRAYLGMMVPNMPNFFMLYGPNSQPVSGGTSMPIWFVLWSAYAAQCLMRMIESGKSRVAVKESAYLRYNEALDEESKKLILLQPEGAPEKNYYVSGGRIQFNAPWYGPEFHRMCSRPDWADLELA